MGMCTPIIKMVTTQKMCISTSTQIQFGILFPWNPDTQNISVSTDSTAGRGECVLL